MANRFSAVCITSIDGHTPHDIAMDYCGPQDQLLVTDLKTGGRLMSPRGEDSEVQSNRVAGLRTRGRMLNGHVKFDAIRDPED